MTEVPLCSLAAIPLDQVLSIWHDFFHASVSCVNIVVLRILLGIVLILNSVLLLPLIDDFFSQDGIWPTAAWQKYSKC